MFKKRIKWIHLASSKSEFGAYFPPSGLKKMIIDSKAICFVKHKDEIYALADRCPHQGASLSEGNCTEDGFVVCPWHRYGYDCKNGRGPGYYVDTFKLEEREDGFFVGIEKGWLEI